MERAIIIETVAGGSDCKRKCLLLNDIGFATAFRAVVGNGNK
jgi:hypothetical protein